MRQPMKIGSEFGAKTFPPTGNVPKDINCCCLDSHKMELVAYFLPYLQPNKGQEGNTNNQQFWAK
jgi:hypothetical protein